MTLLESLLGQSEPSIPNLVEALREIHKGRSVQRERGAACPLTHASGSRTAELATERDQLHLHRQVGPWNE